MTIENLVYENINIKCFSISMQKVEQVVIALHGFAGNADSSVIYAIAKELTKHNIAVIAFDLPCHGKDNHFNKLTVKSCLDSLIAVEKYTLNTYKNVPISFFATSFGGYLLLQHINNSESKYNKIILRCPAIFMDEIFENKILPLHNNTLADLKKENIDLGFDRSIYVSLDFFKELKQLALNNFYTQNYLYIIQGKQDNIVDYKKNETFLNEFCKNKYQIFYLKNADHRFKNDGEIQKIVDITTNIIINS